MDSKILKNAEHVSPGKRRKWHFRAPKLKNFHSRVRTPRKMLATPLLRFICYENKFMLAAIFRIGLFHSPGLNLVSITEVFTIASCPLHLDAICKKRRNKRRSEDADRLGHNRSSCIPLEMYTFYS